MARHPAIPTMIPSSWLVAIGVLLLFPLAVAASPATPAAYSPVIDPANFVARVDNPYFPLVPGTVFHYEGTKDGQPQNNDVTVTTETKTILGVPCVVVLDEVREDDVLVEQTHDWYAQDRDGNVWYFGEASTAYERGKPPSTEGSWEAGVDGALPGIVMPAHPAPGPAYRQEYLAGEAEDMAQVVEVDASATVPYGPFDHVVVTHEWTPLEPGVMEEKRYAPGVGFVQSVSLKGEDERFALVSVASPGGSPVAAPLAGR